MKKNGPSVQNQSCFTGRACLAGLILSFLVIIMAHYSISIVHGSYLSVDHMPAGGIFVFFILVLLINPLLGYLKKSLEFSSRELILVYIMLLITSSITTMGLGAQLCPILATPFYYANPANRWAEIIHPHLKPWLFPQGGKVIRYFFEGLPPGERIPWLAWLKPLSFWFAFIFVLYLVMLCLMVILRKQWVEKERLTYPLVQLPLEMVKTDENKSGRLFKPFFRNKLMWLGFAIPFFISTWNGLYSYFHLFPPIALSREVNIFQNTSILEFRLSFPIMGFTYLINQEVALSVWFFNLLFMLVRGFFNITGISSPENVGLYGCKGDPIFAHLGTGAFIAFVLLGLWMARAHLKQVFARAFGKGEADDSREIIPYPLAVWGLISGTIFLLAWLKLSGMSFLVAFLFLTVAFVFWLGLTRIIAEAGIATMISPSISSSQVVSGMGSDTIGPQGLTSLGLTYPYSSDIRTFPMSAMAQGLKLKENFPGRKRGLFWAIILSIVLTFVVSNWIVIKLAYSYGGINLDQWFFRQGPQIPFEYVAAHINHPAAANQLGWFCRLLGAALMVVLTVMRYRFLWWPLHPLGFSIGAVAWIDRLWFSIFLIWLIKMIFLKYGGVRLFRQARPFFLGLILGQYTAAGLWFIIDLVTGHMFNKVFWI